MCKPAALYEIAGVVGLLRHAFDRHAAEGQQAAEEVDEEAFVSHGDPRTDAQRDEEAAAAKVRAMRLLLLLLLLLLFMLVFLTLLLLLLLVLTSLSILQFEKARVGAGALPARKLLSMRGWGLLAAELFGDAMAPAVVGGADDVQLRGVFRKVIAERRRRGRCCCCSCSRAALAARADVSPVSKAGLPRGARRRRAVHAADAARLLPAAGAERIHARLALPFRPALQWHGHAHAA